MLFGIYGSHTPETCPIYVRKYARVFVDIAGLDPAHIAEVYGIRRIEVQYHSALEHTFLWVVDADDPHSIERFAIETGLASFNMLEIVPVHTFAETVERLKDAHQLGQG
ncbi:MAG: hypothetical protein OXN18_13515 [Gemmatimonadota bacterium]|nr:hypothetical protein [Gemmatimonadota bacterium]